MYILPPTEELFEAFLNRDPGFDGFLWVGVKTTGVFCRMTCSARKPLRKNVEFFGSRKLALIAGYRPCLRCKPMQSGEEVPDWVEKAMAKVEAAEGRRVKEAELRELGVPPDRLRRYFKSHYGMSFQAYARARRLASAITTLRSGTSAIEASVDSGYDSTSGFREAVHNLFGVPPSKASDAKALNAMWIDTQLGPMIAVANDQSLLLLEYVDRRMLEAQMQSLRRRLGAAIIPNRTDVLRATETEVTEYFQGTRKAFTIPLEIPGSGFQQRVWSRLLAIPYGETMSYSALASDIGSPDAQRAVGKANGENRIAIIVPCHRVIKSDGSLCGYGGGIWRKQRLLDLESGQRNLLY